MKKIAIICGGPSAERGISLNSARSLYDNLDRNKYGVWIFYVNPRLKFFKITPAQIYSNTPLDFDFKLKKNSAFSAKKLALELKKFDLVFPAIHGTFGEDGGLQKMLEKIGAAYLGSGPEACYGTANKSLCQKILQKNGFYPIKHWVAQKGEPSPKLPAGRYVVKPLHGGSSIGAQFARSAAEIPQKLKKVFRHENLAIIEPAAQGKEFTVIVLQSASGQPVALLPTEIEFHQDSFFDYRKKYLATGETSYHTPARFGETVIKKIQKEAEKAFSVLKMKDFARIDGWFLNNGKIWFSDINAISGIEQNSFLFQQAALLGLSHRQLLDYLVEKKIERAKTFKKREEIPVLFGGNTAERQVSVMSGTNVWMKLQSSKKYQPVPMLLSSREKIFYLPRFLCLQHTVEEIEAKITALDYQKYFQALQKKIKNILKKLEIKPSQIDEKLFQPHSTTLQKIAKKYRFLFLGLHGGAGEDGTYQKRLDKLKLPYNGSGTVTSALCMDKFKTGQAVEKAKIPGVRTARKMLFKLTVRPAKIWQTMQKNSFPTKLILKPRGDGCSAGVIKISSFDQFKKALNYFKSNKKHIPAGSIHRQHQQIALPSQKLTEIMIEEFIATDKIDLKKLKIVWKPLTDYIEITASCIGEKGKMSVMPPSQTIASQETLSLEEKFMGGTGINLVPPPAPFVKPVVIRRVQKNLRRLAKILNLEGYARIDCFMHCRSGEIIVIEVNTLPALTPSTTFFQQALAMPKPFAPLALLEKIIEIGKKRMNFIERKPRKIYKNRYKRRF